MIKITHSGDIVECISEGLSPLLLDTSVSPGDNDSCSIRAHGGW